MPAVWLHYCLPQHPFWEYNLKKQSYFFLPFSLPQFFIVLLGTGCSSWSPYIKPMFWDFFQGKLLSVSIEKINAACFHKNWFGRSGWLGAVGVCVNGADERGFFLNGADERELFFKILAGRVGYWGFGIGAPPRGNAGALANTLPTILTMKMKVFSLAKLSSS